MRAWKLRCYIGRMGGRPPCQPTARLPHRAARHRLGYEATCTVQGARKLTGSLHTSSSGQATLGPCQPRADKRCRSSSAAKPDWITDDGHFSCLNDDTSSQASAGWHQCTLLLPEHFPPTTCLITFYILGNGNSRARHSTDRPRRRHLAQKFSVIFTNNPSIQPPSLTAPFLFISYSLIPPACRTCLALSCVSCNFLSLCIYPSCRSTFPVSAFVDTLLLVQRACPSLLR